MSSAAGGGRELIVHGGGGGATEGVGARPIIVFQSLSDAQFDKALQLFQPVKKTKFTLMADAELTRQMATVAGYLESIQYTSGSSQVFSEKMVANHFDNAVTKLLPEDEPPFVINEWVADIRSEVATPPEIAKYNPNADQNDDYMPMPEYKGLNVDWLDVLSEQELAIPGFVAVFYNCLQMQRTIQAEVQRNRTYNSPLMCGAEQSHRRPPSPKVDNAALLEITTSALLDRFYQN